MNSEFHTILSEVILKRKKSISEKFIKQKTALSTQQLQDLESGNIHFVKYPYNYYLIKQYVSAINPNYTSYITDHEFRSGKTYSIIDKKNLYQSKNGIIKKIKELLTNLKLVLK